MSHIPERDEIHRLRASLRRTYLSLETDEERNVFLDGISKQIGGTTPENVELWLTATTRALEEAERKQARRPRPQPALIHRRRRGIQK